MLGMVVRREREIREFVKTPFYRVLATLEADGNTLEGEWKAVKGSRYFESFDLYKENGFKQKEKAQELIAYLQEEKPVTGQITAIEKGTKKKNPRFFIIWQNCRMTVPGVLSSVRIDASDRTGAV